MAKLSAAHLKIVVEATAIATSPAPMPERADALLDTVHKIVPFDAARIALLDPDDHGHGSLAHRGYRSSLLARVEGAEVLRELRLVGLGRLQSAPMRAQDALGVLEHSVIWEEYLRPAGVRDSLGLGLSHPDGRYLGVLAMLSGSSSWVTDEALPLCQPRLRHLSSADY